MENTISFFTVLKQLQHTILELEDELEKAGAWQDSEVLQALLTLKECHLKMLKEGKWLRSYVFGEEENQ